MLTAGDTPIKSRKYVNKMLKTIYCLKTAMGQINIQPKIRRSTGSILFSVLMPVYRTRLREIVAAINSVISQSYTCWQLCVVDDASKKPILERIVQRYVEKDHRIVALSRIHQGGISEATNDALRLATGEYSVLLDHDDVLSIDALRELASFLRDKPGSDVIYSDEDKISAFGLRHSPYLKPNWSPDLLLCKMYSCHLGCYRTELLREIGGFRKEYDGAQDHDLMLRLADAKARIEHLPKTLYHWRSSRSSTSANARAKSYAANATLRAVQSALDRRGEGGKAMPHQRLPGHCSVSYPVPTDCLLSVIIPYRNRLDLLEKCVSSLFAISSFQRFEVILIDNESDPWESEVVVSRLKRIASGRLRVIQYEGAFNFSRICNRGAASAAGNLLHFLNSDTELLENGSLAAMAGFAARASIGAVGAFLSYPDDTIQHAGIVLGVKGVANHHHLGFPIGSPGNNMGQLLCQTNYSAVTGACLMVKKQEFSAVGGFDEKLQIAFGDVDLCLKLLQKGLYNVVLPEARFRHLESASRGPDAGEAARRLAEETTYFMRVWGEQVVSDPFYNPNLTKRRLDFTPELVMWKK